MLIPRLIRAGLALLALLSITSAAMAEQVNFSGEVTYLERVELPPGAELVVTLVSLPDATPIVNAAAPIAAPGRVPLQYSFNVSSDVIRADRQFGLTAEIRIGQQIVFRNLLPVPVDPAAAGATLIVVALAASPLDTPAAVPPDNQPVVAPTVETVVAPQPAPVITPPVEPATPLPEPTPVVVPAQPVVPPEVAEPIQPVEPATPPEETASPVEAEPPVAPPLDAAEVVAPDEPTNPLLDTAWDVIGIDGDPVLKATELTLTIAADRRAGGSGGCNNYFAEAKFNTLPLSFGPVASTRMACEPATMEQEAAFFAALDTVVSYELAGNSLSLLNALAVPVIELNRQ
jgi:heat shock protein HslJ/uncharacterized lipoprotein YbaY